jgi:hypothetical protein
LEYVVAIWHILRPIGKFNGHLVSFAGIWYICSRFGVLNYQEKSGNPGSDYFEVSEIF